MSAMLEDQLLQVQEASLVIDLLTHLDNSPPHIGRVRLCALRALLARNNIDNLKSLLQQDTVLHRVLDCELDLDAPRVGFCPDEAGIDNADLVETAQLLEA